jgi:hypothetical protein
LRVSRMEKRLIRGPLLSSSSSRVRSLRSAPESAARR